MWASDYALCTLDEDVERVKAVRRAVGPGFKLAIDANNAWTPPSPSASCGGSQTRTSSGWRSRCRPTTSPAAPRSPTALDVPVAGYESETGLGGFRDLIERKAVDIVQPDVIWTGGITECKKVAALAHAHRLPVIPHVFSSAVAAIANMHFIASIPTAGCSSSTRTRTRSARSCSRSRSRSDPTARCGCRTGRDWESRSPGDGR
jgi:L-alanine-DL-glutamate epimerase-like enolase superfamily enzyme